MGMNALESLPPLQQQLVKQITDFIKPFAKALFPFSQQDHNFYWLLIVSTLLFGVLGWVWFERKPGEGIGEFFRRHLGRELWGHPSARVDYRYYLINAGVFALMFGPLLMSSAVLSEQLWQVLTSTLGTGPAWESGTTVRVVYTLLMFVAYDFGRWLAHTLLHDVPLLWEFHKVHHSAEVLTPFTAYRVHPLDLLLTHTVPVLTTAPVTAAFLFLFPQSVDAYTFLTVNFLLGLTGLMANLKHWQVWITYGPLNGWWISPAHHQIHHSAEARHWNMNRGFELGIWDRMYGSLYVPSRERENFKMGLGDGSDGEWHTVRTLYFRPFRLAWKRLRHVTPAGAALLLAAFCAGGFADRAEAASPVFMEELTWPELSARIAGGASIALVPIGGTEQNGPQMTLGKHNAIVRYCAEEIARRQGNILVAPVLPLAPEGSFAPRSGNMVWPGTLGLREETLAAVLEDVVASLVLHGFRSIVFIGDHGGSQAMQEHVAKEQSAARTAQGIRVLNLSRYYDSAPLTQRLQGTDIPATAVGDHAGVVDTAELLAAKPDWVRHTLQDPKTWKGFVTPPGPGASGRPNLATPEIGRVLLEQRIVAAISQLQELLK